MAGAVKTSGAKGLHVFVPLAAGSSPEDVAAATRAVAARAERIDPDLATTAFVKEEREPARSFSTRPALVAPQS